MQIKIDKADTIFSKYIRLRDKKCCRCWSEVHLNENGDPISHTNSHYFGRRKENTRFDIENCDTLCLGCHQIWGSDDHEAYRDFKIKQLGEQGFKNLTIRSNLLIRKDRGVAYIYAKKLYDEIINKPPSFYHS